MSKYKIPQSYFCTMLPSESVIVGSCLLNTLVFILRLDVSQLATSQEMNPTSKLTEKSQYRSKSLC